MSALAIRAWTSGFAASPPCWIMPKAAGSAEGLLGSTASPAARNKHASETHMQCCEYCGRAFVVVCIPVFGHPIQESEPAWSVLSNLFLSSTTTTAASVAERLMMHHRSKPFNVHIA